MELGGERIPLVLNFFKSAPYIFDAPYSTFRFTARQVKDLMDHGIPFRRKVAEGGRDSD